MEHLSCKTSAVGTIAGPGSLDFPVRIDLKELRLRLSQAGHELAQAPQWNGDKLYLAICTAGELSPKIAVIAGPSKENARLVALNNAKTREIPDWDIEVHEINMTSSKSVQLLLG